MLSEEKIRNLIEKAKVQSQETREILGKEVYQKRFKPVYEGYITALCNVLETDDDTKTEEVRGRKE